eukprot:31095-Pelagococcus_subviridis.AAC.1
MQSGESIYDLIPKPVEVPERPPIYVSQVRASRDPRIVRAPRETRVAGPRRRRRRRARTRSRVSSDRARASRRTNPRGSHPLPFEPNSDPPRAHTSRNPPLSQHPKDVDAERRSKATFGHAIGSLKPIPTNFLKSHAKEPVLPSRAPPIPSRRPRRTLAVVRLFSRESAPVPAKRGHLSLSRPTLPADLPRSLVHPPPFEPNPSTAERPTRERATLKPPVPSKEERPTMGLVSKKNFVYANAVENILSKPPTKTAPTRMTEKPEYGKVPKYLETIKSQISAEKAFIAAREEELAKEQSGRTRELSQEEVDGLVRDMKIKWAKLNDAYGRLPFTLDVPSKKRKKEELEKEMTQLEKDIKRLQGRRVVVVY